MESDWLELELEVLFFHSFDSLELELLSLLSLLLSLLSSLLELLLDDDHAFESDSDDEELDEEDSDESHSTTWFCLFDERS